MGQVFTWDAVRLGQIPKKESFRVVENLTRVMLSVEPAVVSALLFGSVIRGDSSIRSDVDCVVVYKTDQEHAAMKVMNTIDRMAHALHVPVNFTPCDTVLAGTRLHHLGVSFVRHLQASIDAGGLIKGEFLGLLAPTISPEQEIESYIKMKMYSMQESLAGAPSFSDERMALFLKKGLEATTHVARKMLIYESVLQGDSKREIQKRYKEVMPKELADMLDFLLELDLYYSMELDVQVRHPNLDNYKRVLSQLFDAMPLVLTFLRANIIRLNAAAR